MRLGLALSFLVHGTVVAALAFFGLRAARPQPERVFAVEFHVDDPIDIEPLAPESASPETPALEESWEVPDEEPALDLDVEAPSDIGLGGGALPPRAGRLRTALRHRAAAAPVVPPARVVALPAPRKVPKLNPPRLLADRSPSAAYPERARRAGHEGDVVLLVRVGPDGAVASVEVATSSGFEELDRAAAEAAKLWRFEPAREDGKAVAYELRVPVQFRLTD